MAGVSTIHRGGSRFYVDPDDGSIKVPGVTSIVGMIPKDFLGPWNAKMVAEECYDNLGAVVNLAVAGNRTAAVDMLKGAARRYTKERSDIGSTAHDIFERMAAGESVGRVHADMRPYVEHFQAWLDDHQPEVISAENCAWSDAHQYAGSYDLIAKVGGEVAVIDYKTGKSTYPDVALQLSAYAFADRIIDPDGGSTPMPEIRAGAVLHITPDRAEFKPVEVSERVFAQFLHLRRTFDWQRDGSKSVLGKPIWTRGEMQTGTQRRG